MAVQVARDGPDVVGRDDAPASIVQPAQRRGRRPGATARRRPAGPAAGGAGRTPRRASRHGSSRPGRSRSTRRGPRPGQPHPRCTPACGPTARGPAGPSSSGRTGSPPAARVARRPASRAPRPAAASRTSRPAGELDDAGGRRQEVEQRHQQRRLADVLASAGDHERDEGLDEQPDRRRELGIEHADPISSTIERGSGGTAGTPSALCAGDVGHGRSLGRRARAVKRADGRVDAWPRTSRRFS